MDECLFCRIVAKKIPAQIEYEDEFLIAVQDIQPKAPCHILVLSKKHIPTLAEAGAGDGELFGRMILQGKALAEKKAVAKSGFRLVFNSGPDGGQSVNHIHLHVLGGRSMGWPPG